MFILLEDLVKSCVRGREEEKGGHVLRDTLAAACMDESDHLALVNAGDEEVVSQEEGGREGSAAGGEEGGRGAPLRRALPGSLDFGVFAFLPFSLGPADRAM